MRAFGGIRIDDDQSHASTKRCEELTDNDEIKYNNETMLWSTFKMKRKGG